jgi:hypothetical protein
MIGWSITDLEKKIAARTLVSYKVVNHNTSKPAKNLNKLLKPTPEGIKFIKQQLADAGIDFVTEWTFAKPRRWRFDIAVIALKVAFEYEGLVATGKKGGHQTKKHYTENCEKYNAAATLGWTVYRYTFLNYTDFENDLKAIFK